MAFPYLEAIEFLVDRIVDAGSHWLEFDHNVHSTLRDIGYSGEELANMTSALIDNTRGLANKIGVSQEEILKVQQGINESLKTRIQLTQQEIALLGAQGKVFGQDTVMQWQTAMKSLGGGISAAGAHMQRLSVHAKTFGLNSKDHLKTLAKNVELMEKMNFRGGIAGLSRMTALATRLGVDLQSMTRAIDVDGGNFSSIEGSIEASAKLQRLGGSFAAGFSNPMEVMAEGMFDPEGFTNRLVDMVKGKGTFNKETGMVERGWIDNKMLAEAANALGMNAQELRKMADAELKGGEIENALRKNSQFSNFKDSDIGALKNLAQFNADTKTWEISYTGSDGKSVTQDISKIDPKDMEQIINLSDPEKELQVNVANIAGNVAELTKAAGRNAHETLSQKERADGFVESNKGVAANIVDWVSNPVKEVGKLVSNAWDSIVSLGSGHANGGIVEPSPTGIEGVQKFEKGGIVVPNPLPKFDSGGLIPGSSTSGDQVLTRTNSGEMVLNKAQQTNLYNIANSNKSNATVSNTLISKVGGSVEKVGQQIQSVGKAIDKINGRKVKQGFRLVKDFYKLKYDPTQIGNQQNLTTRFVRRKLNRLDPRLGKAAEDISYAVRDFTNTVKEPFKTFGRTVKSKVSNSWAGKAYRGAKDLIKGEIKTVKGDIVSVKKWFDTTKVGQKVAKFGEKVGKASSSVGSFGKTLGKQTLNIAKGVGNFTKAAASWVVSKGGGLISKFGGELAGLKGVGKLGSLTKGFSGGGLIKGLAVAQGVIGIGSAISNENAKIKQIENDESLSSSQKKKLKREVEDQRNEEIGKNAGAAAGAFAGKVVSKAIATIPVVGTAASAVLSATGIDSMIGSWIGGKVGGFIGKNFNNAKDFLFGKKAELSDEEQAQLDYEETKMGEVDITDPEIMEKGAQAMCASHDLLVSIWHHMNGKASNGEEIKKGLFTRISNGIKNTVSGVMGIATAPFRAAGNVVSGLFSKKKNGKEEEIDKEKKEGEEQESELTLIQKDVAYIASILKDGGVKPKGDEVNENKGTKFVGKALGATIGGAIGTAILGPIGTIAGAWLGAKLSGKKTIDEKNGIDASDKTNTTEGVLEAKTSEGEQLASESKPMTNESIEPRPIGEDKVQVNTSVQESNVNVNSSNTDNINLNINGTIRLEGGNGQSKDIDMKKLLDSPEIKNYIMDFVARGLSNRANNGRDNLNSQNTIRNYANSQRPLNS